MCAWGTLEAQWYFEHVPSSSSASCIMYNSQYPLADRNDNLPLALLHHLCTRLSPRCVPLIEGDGSLHTAWRRFSFDSRDERYCSLERSSGLSGGSFTFQHKSDIPAFPHSTASALPVPSVQFPRTYTHPPHPTRNHTPLIKRTPSARPHDAETGLSLVYCCLAAWRTPVASSSRAWTNKHCHRRSTIQRVCSYLFS